MMNDNIFFVCVRQQARQNIFEYIETYYNRQRHSAIGNQIPMQYELKMSA